MNTVSKTQQGLSLLELMLVLAIISAIIVLGAKQVKAWERAQEIQQVNYNVNQIFQLLSSWYRAQCEISRDYSDGTPLISQTGILDPSYTPTPTNPYYLDIGAKLFYLSTSWPPAKNSIVDDTATNYGYVAQYNRITPTSNKMNVYYNHNLNEQPLGTDYSSTQVTVSKNYVWKAQVAVKLKNPSQRNAYKAALNATCISDVGSVANTITPCDQNPPVTGSYLVWERLPSMSLGNRDMSNLWVSTPTLLQFKRQYTNDSFFESDDTQYEADGITKYVDDHYYLCGG